METDSFKNLSVYRTELMGYAILGVFVCHFVSRTGVHSILLGTVPRLVYTQGFLFLSGFGLYYSYTKNNDIAQFFIKRLKRLYIPFFLMSFPFFLAVIICKGQGVLDMIGYLSTITFWIKGNYFGMWYVSVSIVMYLLFPLMYKWMFKRVVGVELRSLLVILLMVMVFYFILKEYPSYFNNIGMWAKKAVMFPIGMFCGYVSQSERYDHWKSPRFIIPTLCVAFVVTKVFIGFFYEYARSLLGLFLFPIIFLVLSKYRHFCWILHVLKWLGTYSLELYILHVLSFKTIDAIYGRCNSSEMLLTVVLALLLCQPVHHCIEWVINKTN